MSEREQRVRAAVRGPHGEVLRVLAMQPVRGSCRIDEARRAPMVPVPGR